MKPSQRLILFISMLLPFVSACTETLDKLDRIKHQGYIKILTRNAGTTYYEGAEGPSGLEYEMARGFANELGVDLQLIVANNVAEVLNRLAKGEADLAAAGLTITPGRKLWYRFTPPYQEISQQLVYRRGTPAPKNLSELKGRLEVTAASSHAETLRVLSDMYSGLDWGVRTSLDSEDLLTSVWEKEISYTVVDSNEFQLNQRYYPEVRIAFDLTNPEPLAWAFPKFRDDSLYHAASDYIRRLNESGKMDQLIERHYGHLNKFDYVGTRIFLRHIDSRLPAYKELFKKAADTYGLDWRLLAAMAYQESHWDRKAVSPTGVRGLMMLTEDTASQLGLTDRTDPAQSIEGGARYLLQLINTIPDRIPEPDLTWFALASYNIGYGHLEDARVLTERRGGNPDSWKDVKENLPLLRQKKWYKTLKRGYARGNEAYQYVENIRSYYDVLVWMEEKEKQLALEEKEELEAAPQVLTIALPDPLEPQLSDSASSER